MKTKDSLFYLWATDFLMLIYIVLHKRAKSFRRGCKFHKILLIEARKHPII